MLRKIFVLLFFISFLSSYEAFSKTLIISDSHGTGAFGGELARLIETKNENVSFYAFGGTKAVDWIEGNNLTWGYWEHHSGRTDHRGTNRNTPKLVELIKTHAPSTIIIVLGTNMIWREQITKDADDVRFLLNSAKISSTKCFWVGQPDLNPKTEEQKRWDSELKSLFEKEVPVMGCQLIRSWDFTNYPENTGDGVHYDQIPFIGKSLARDWAQKVFKQL